MKYILLALLQGITEFVPVSSSGHLVFFQKVFGFKEHMLSFDIILHLATTLAVIVFLRKDLSMMAKEWVKAFSYLLKKDGVKKAWNEFAYFRLGGLMIVALVPAIIIGVTLDEFIEKMFGSLLFVGIAFFVTGAILFFTKHISSNRELKKVNSMDAFLIGVSQALAIVPGVSRSGFTIAMGIFRGLDKNVAARFSFLLSIPTILAASIYKLKDGLGEFSIGISWLIGSFVVAFLSGYLALIFLSKMVAKAKFHYFSFYCWLMGAISIGLFFLNKA